MAIREVKKRRKRLAPYVPASALSQFFDHIRYVKTPDKVTSGLLEDYNLPKGHAFALLSSLKFLGLVEDDGTPNPAYKALQTSGEEFRSNLEEIVRRAYSDLFSVVDPARNGREHIKNFFARNYSPATAERATALFLDLCGEASIPTLEEKPAATKTKQAPSKPKVRTITTGVSDEEPRGEKGEPDIPVSDDELRRMYLKKLIDQVSTPDTAGKDSEAIKAEAELRKAELDRIEKLIGITDEKEEKE